MTRKSIKNYKKGKVIIVNDKMQKNYSYTLEENPGKRFREDFKPYFTPKKMLELGVFEGKYLNDCHNELPREWYTRAKTSEEADPSLNYFGLKSRLSLQEWRRRGWVPCHKKDKDVRGWFQWYCRYWLGRRIPEVDDIQIKRWRAFKRHYAQVKKNAPRRLAQRKRQRQALLQWSWNCFI